MRIMSTTGTNISIDNLRNVVDFAETNVSIDSLSNIVHFAETYNYLTCGQSDLIGIGCSDCPYYVSDHMLKCYKEDGLPTLIR